MVIYFSGTGNSKYVADMLCDKLNDQLVNAGQLIKDKEKIDLQSDKPWIFVSPVYAWQIPHIFEQFIKEANFKGSKTAYFIVTCGGDIGNTPAQINSICKEIGLEFKGFSSINMPDGYIAMYPASSKEKADKIMEQAIPQIEKYADIIKNEDTLKYKKRAFIMDRVKSSIINPLFYKFSAKANKFNVSKDKCISCGKCSKVCCLNNIELIDGFPTWRDSCTHCMACISYCPTEAIEYGKKTIGRTRYTCKTYSKNDA